MEVIGFRKLAYRQAKARQDTLKSSELTFTRIEIITYRAILAKVCKAELLDHYEEQLILNLIFFMSHQ